MPQNSPNPKHRAKETQLIIGLKFHYSQTLADLPLEVAVDAMVKVWESCHPEATSSVTKPLMSNRPRRVSPPKKEPPQSSGTIYL